MPKNKRGYQYDQETKIRKWKNIQTLQWIHNIAASTKHPKWNFQI